MSKARSAMKGRPQAVNQKAAWSMVAGKYMAELRRDAGYALRALRRTPGFTATVMATLALGIGASTAIFTVVDGVLLRPLQFAEPQRLTMIRLTSGSRVSAAYVHEWRTQSQAFHDMTGWHDVRASLTARGAPLEVLADRVTSNFFAVLGVPAFLGRTFTTASDLSDVKPEVVLSHGLWQRRYGADPSVIGVSITVGGETFSIIGVMPEGFVIRTTELAESRAELWMPLRLVPGNRTGMGGTLNVVARLAPGVTHDEAQAELSLIARRIEQEHPSYSRNWGVDVVPLHEATVKDVRATLLVLFGAVGILLLIGCANVANLVFSRVATRRTELAIRFSLGATRGRLARQLLTESFVLAIVGGAFGVVIGVWATQFVVWALPAGVELPRTGEIGVDLRIVLFALVVTMLTALLFGLLPSVISGQWACDSALREETRGSTAGFSRTRIGSVLIVSEVALAVILLSAAGLLGRSFQELTRVHPGFQPDHVLTMRMTLPDFKYATDDRIRAFGGELLERIKNLPGIETVGYAEYLPLNRMGRGGPFDIEGRHTPPEERPASWTTVVGGRYFETMGIPLLRGRLPGDADTQKSPYVLVIDEELARRYWPTHDPIGARLSWKTGDGERLSGEIVGVVGSVRWAGVATDPNPTMYSWFSQVPCRDITIVARVAGLPSAMADLIAAQIRTIDPDQPVAEIRAMQDLVAADLARPRFTMIVLGGFAGAALLLAAIGLYGVIAFVVARRTREIGVHIALGAQRHDVLRLVLQRGILLIGTGLIIGVAATLAIGRLLAGLLFEVAANDPATLLGVMLLLAAVAMLATYLPARRATRVDPIVALKAE